MPIETEDAGFLSRWSRRKAQTRQGLAVAEPEVAGLASVAPAPPAPASPETTALPVQRSARTGVDTEPESQPLPTLADVAALDRDSDYTRFVGRGVQPEVKNAALAKLFTDPHFNVMDRLDTYIDDYGKPDPLPPGMLRQMVQAHGLGLFDDEEKPVPPGQAAGALAQTPAVCDAAMPNELSSDENTDLQLQPDDDAGCASAEPGPGQDAGGQHGRAGDGSHAAVSA